MDEIKKQTRMNRRLHRKPGSGQTRLNVWDFSVCRTRTKPGMSAKGIQRSGIVPLSPYALVYSERLHA